MQFADAGEVLVVEDELLRHPSLEEHRGGDHLPREYVPEGIYDVHTV
jgi:hypothetical protein